MGEIILNANNIFVNVNSDKARMLAAKWYDFLVLNKFDFATIQKIDLGAEAPIIFDKLGNKFSIDFVNNKLNYMKKKGSIKTELISKALGAGKQGLNILDLGAGLGIDAVFLSQLGYKVTALERNPLIFLALTEALKQKSDLELKIIFSESSEYLKNQIIETDLVYFDPMFPEKRKSALPRQEMVFFKNLVGPDEDAADVLSLATLKAGAKRLVVKRPLKAPALLKPNTTLSGKLIRFDIYNGVKKA